MGSTAAIDGAEEANRSGLGRLEIGRFSFGLWRKGLNARSERRPGTDSGNEREAHSVPAAAAAWKQVSDSSPPLSDAPPLLPLLLSVSNSTRS